MNVAMYLSANHEKIWKKKSFHRKNIQFLLFMYVFWLLHNQMFIFVTALLYILFTAINHLLCVYV